MVWNGTRRPSPGVLSTAALIAALGLAGASADAANSVAECGSGRWVVDGVPLVADSVPRGADVVSLSSGNVEIASGCPATVAKVVGGSRRTRVRARWETCGNRERVRLTARIAAG